MSSDLNDGFTDNVGHENENVNQEDDVNDDNEILNEISKNIREHALENTSALPSSSSSFLEIGYKQNIIEELKKYEEFYQNHLIQMNSFIKMSELYLDAAKQLYDFSKDVENYGNYEKIELNKVNVCKKRAKLMEDCIQLVKDSQQYMRETVSIRDAGRLLASIKKSYEIRNAKFRNNLEQLRPLFIYKHLESFNWPSIKCKINLVITVIGRRGAGKSSFINVFRNLDSFHPDAALTDDVECTRLSKFYPFDYGDDMNTMPKIYLLDFPGVGTDNFPSSDYTEMLMSMQSDAYIYLFQYSVDELDLKILGELNVKLKKRAPIFLVRNKIDMDFESYVCTELKVQSLEERPDMDKLVEENWINLRHAILNHYESEMKFLLEICTNKKLYFVSSDIFYKRYFDYEELIKDLIKNMSDSTKADTLYKAFKKKCLQIKGYFSFEFMNEMFFV